MVFIKSANSPKIESIWIEHCTGSACSQNGDSRYHTDALERIMKNERFGRKIQHSLALINQAIKITAIHFIRFREFRLCEESFFHLVTGNIYFQYSDKIWPVFLLLRVRPVIGERLSGPGDPFCLVAVHNLGHAA